MNSALHRRMRRRIVERNQRLAFIGDCVALAAMIVVSSVVFAMIGHWLAM